jgi:hypothetical protein
METDPQEWTEQHEGEPRVDPAAHPNMSTQEETLEVMEAMK